MTANKAGMISYSTLFLLLYTAMYIEGHKHKIDKATTGVYIISTSPMLAIFQEITGCKSQWAKHGLLCISSTNVEARLETGAFYTSC